MVADTRHLIAITPEHPVSDEGHKIEALLRAGWYRVHIRHPHASRVEMRGIIESVPLRYHDRLVLHGHFDLTCDFTLGGLHLNHRCPVPPALYTGPLSRSCHSIAELSGNGTMSYVTLSPILDSISKSGYQAAFTPEALAMLDRYDTPVIALGGVSPEHFATLNRYRFSGYAMLGAIPWESTCDEVYDFASRCIAAIASQDNQ